MTTWTGERTKMWEAALDEADRRQRELAMKRKKFSSVAMAAVGGVALLVLAVGILLPSLGRARSSSRSVAVESARVQAEMEAVPTYGLHDRHEPSPSSPAIGGFAETKSRPADDALRQIIRKATVELASKDVRGGFLKAQHLVRADLGEFVESSSLTGQEATAHGQLVLRVTAARLSEVLNQVRDLGTVQNEQSGGDDVTDQVVDLEARLRNEKSVEQELLNLLKTRQNAPLEDVLKLREKLTQVRQTIEQLQGRRDTIGRQVALATVIVIIRADGMPEEPKPGMSDWFFAEMESSWNSALRGLTSTIAFLVRVIVGGAIVWIGLIVGGIAAYRMLRRAVDAQRPDAPVLARTS